MDVVAALVADAEAAVLVQPGDRALDHPTLLAEIVALLILFILMLMLGAALSNVANERLRVALAVVIGVAVLFLAVLYDKGRTATTKRDS